MDEVNSECNLKLQTAIPISVLRSGKMYFARLGGSCCNSSYSEEREHEGSGSSQKLVNPYINKQGDMM
jgi:hypothetical protein